MSLWHVAWHENKDVKRRNGSRQTVANQQTLTKHPTWRISNFFCGGMKNALTAILFIIIFPKAAMTSPAGMKKAEHGGQQRLWLLPPTEPSFPCNPLVATFRSDSERMASTSNCLLSYPFCLSFLHCLTYLLYVPPHHPTLLTFSVSMSSPTALLSVSAFSSLFDFDFGVPGCSFRAFCLPFSGLGVSICLIKICLHLE